MRRRFNKYEVKGYVTVFYTTGGVPFVVDTEDKDKVESICWSFDSHGYLRGQPSMSNKKVWLHRFIMGVTDSNICVDHIDHDKTNCRKSNLRLCTQAQNNMNMPKMKTNKSNHIGVSWDKTNKKWRAHISVNNKTKTLGRYKNFDDAVKARRIAEEYYYGEFAPTYNQNIYKGG